MTWLLAWFGWSRLQPDWLGLFYFLRGSGNLLKCCVFYRAGSGRCVSMLLQMQRLAEAVAFLVFKFSLYYYRRALTWQQGSVEVDHSLYASAAAISLIEHHSVRILFCWADVRTVGVKIKINSRSMDKKQLLHRRDICSEKHVCELRDRDFEQYVILNKKLTTLDTCFCRSSFPVHSLRGVGWRSVVADFW